ncbi:protocatechuate 3,4-dioxygenase subunit alpha [Hydrocarboniphaga sp.]|uniref:protocatechuate 3,4-dioxygenase subunit alpha n=1 Tax=Hydrocarboniphaga sp. TaxID=2033016 RepID=UPI003D149676
MSLQTTPSQTVGPYFRIGVEPLYRDDIAGPEALGERIGISGSIRDGDGVPVSDAFIEIWQADAAGVYRHSEDPRAAAANSAFGGFGRVAMDEQGQFRFSTIKPGRVPGADGQPQAPHLSVLIYMRGILKPVLTRIYFGDEAQANERDPVLALVPVTRRATLIATPDGDRAYAWHVHMQGEHEIVAFSV